MADQMADQIAIPTKIKVINVTKKLGGRGRFLDPGEKYGNRLIAPGYSMLFECKDGMYPDCVHDWLEKGFCSVYDAMSGADLGAPVSGDLSPGVISPLREMTGTQDQHAMEKNAHDDDLFEDDFDLGSAREATLPSHLAGEGTAPMRPDTRQQYQPNVRISSGKRDEEAIGAELSPIPGDRPRSLDNEANTIRAPRTHAVGSVIGKK